MIEYEPFVIMKLLLSTPGLLAQLLLLTSAIRDSASFAAIFHDAATTMSSSSSLSVFSVHPRGRPLPRLFVVSSSSVADVDNDGVEDVDSDPPEAISTPASAVTSKMKMTSDLKALLPKQKMRFMKVS